MRRPFLDRVDRGDDVAMLSFSSILSVGIRPIDQHLVVLVRVLSVAQENDLGCLTAAVMM